MGFGGCAVLSCAVIRFINAGITSHRDSSSLLVLTHSVTSFLRRAIGGASVRLSLHLPLSFSCSGSRRLSVSQTLSAFFFFLPVSFLSPFPSLSLLPSLASFLFSTLLLPPCHFCLCLSLSLSLSLVTLHSSICGCRHERQPQTGRPPRLHKVT